MLESLFDKVVSLKVCSFMKKRLQRSYFSLNIAKYLRTPILKNICQRLLQTKIGRIFHSLDCPLPGFHRFQNLSVSPEVLFSRHILKSGSESRDPGPHDCWHSLE